MNELELLRGEIAAVSVRMKRLEVIFQSRGVISQDSAEAERLAGAMGFHPEIVYLPRDAGTKKSARERRELARRLHQEKKWSGDRIARALGCCERSVRRMLA